MPKPFTAEMRRMLQDAAGDLGIRSTLFHGGWVVLTPTVRETTALERALRQ